MTLAHSLIAHSSGFSWDEGVWFALPIIGAGAALTWLNVWAKRRSARQT
ncbi:MAG: hypothetical protein P8N02_02085 [Actinomycetota bacterium]|jgi:hypothetical protein|nr:hypothetical protein [Actinomycetota bacterium]